MVVDVLGKVLSVVGMVYCFVCFGCWCLSLIC